MQATPKQYAEAWYQLLAGRSAQKRSEATRRMLLHLYRNNRVRWLADIVRNMERLAHRASGAEAVTVRASRKLSAAEARQLAADVMGAPQASVAVRVDPLLLGGVQIETANHRWDLSLAARLAKLHNRLTT